MDMTLSALDYEEIRQVITRYCHGLDFQDWDMFVNCFTQDGSFEAESVRDDLNGKHEGREDLLQFGKAVASYCAGHVRHSAVSTLIEANEQGARARSYCIIWRDYGEPNGLGQDTPFTSVITSGVYDDQLVKSDDGRWRIKERVFSYDGLPRLMNQVGKPLGRTRAPVP
jgi:hypothetical protein